MIIPFNKIPIVKKNILSYILEDIHILHTENELWLEFGVFNGTTINYISKFTKYNIYGFDSFYGLPNNWSTLKKGTFNLHGQLPKVNQNVVLIPGLFSDTLHSFLLKHNKLISFIHIDCDTYQSTSYVLDTCYNYLKQESIIVFDELINYKNFWIDGELKALSEWVNKYNIDIEWIGMKNPIGNSSKEDQAVAIRIYK